MESPCAAQLQSVCGELCIRDREEGGKNDLIERICADPSFGLDYDEVEAILKPEDFTGRAEQQVEEFLAEIIDPLLAKHADALGIRAELSV